MPVTGLQILIALAIGFLAYYFQVPIVIGAKDTKTAAVATAKEAKKVATRVATGTSHVVTHVVTHPIGKKK